MRKVFVIIITALFIGTFHSCHYTDIVPFENEQESISDNVSFDTDIEPIFQAQSCTSCHPDTYSPNLRTGYAYESLTEKGYVNADIPENSLIYLIPSPMGDHFGKYTSEQAQLLLAWIEQGANDN